MSDRIELDHIALAVRDIAEAPQLLVGELGGRPDQGGPGPGYRGGQWLFEGGGRLEILEPAGPPEGFLHRFVARHGPGVHHVTFKVPSLRRICERARSLAYEIVGYSDSSPAWKEAFLHPRQALGIVVQLVETDPRHQDSWGPHWELPQGPPDPPPPARLVGLRLGASREALVRRQWSELLEGECRPDGELLVFEWPGSPLRIAVELREAQSDGPLLVELSSPRALALPQGKHPRLGAAFVQLRA